MKVEGEVQPALAMMSSTEIPSHIAVEEDAALVECDEKSLLFTPALDNALLNQPMKVPYLTGV